MTDTQDLIAQLRLGASISRDRNLSLDFAKVADEAADKLEAAQAEIERLKAVTFEPGELAAHGIKTPTPREFGARITERLEKRWLAVAEKVQAERDAALARLAEIEGQEPIGCGYLIEYELGNTPSTYKKGHAFVTGVNVYAAAGASPVQPIQARCQYCDGTGDVHGIDGEWRGSCTACKPAQPSQAGEPDASAKTWCEYVAGMVGCYLGEPVESDKCKAIAAIIFRRLWALPLQMPSQAGELSDAEILSAWGKHTLASDYNKYTLKEHVLRAGKEIIAAINANGVK